MKIYMIWPRSTASYYSPSDYSRWGRGRSMLANLALPTLAALTPADVEVEICDADLASPDFQTDAEVIALSGFYINWWSMRAIADEFRRRGKLVVIGGPFATLSHDTVRPHADILVRGEAERIWPSIVEDIRQGRWLPEYIEHEHVDITQSPVPRWDLLPVEHYAQTLVQTARGCPYSCDFCDVVTIFGRKVRGKTPDQVLSELELLYRLGSRFVMLADDNLTVHRGHAERILTAIRDWNRTLPQPVYFSTQLSIDLAWHEDLMVLAAEAGLTWAYIGIESSNPESLIGVNKLHNARSDLIADIERLTSHGIVVLGGLISGFDQDGPGVFDQHAQFIGRTPVAFVSCNLLVASEGTVLYDRLAEQERLVDGGGKATAGDQFFSTNIVPAKMSVEELVRGNRRLVERLYRPRAFGRRFDRLMRRLPRKRRQPRMRFLPTMITTGRLLRLGNLLAYARSLLRLGTFYLQPGNWRLAATFACWIVKRPWYLDVIGTHMALFAQVTHVHAEQGISADQEPPAPHTATEQVSASFRDERV